MSTGLHSEKPAVEYLHCFFYREGSFTDDSQFLSCGRRLSLSGEKEAPPCWQSRTVAGIPSRSESIARVSRCVFLLSPKFKAFGPVTPPPPTHTHTKWWWVVWKI